MRYLGFVCLIGLLRTSTYGQIVEPYTDDRCIRTGCNGEICGVKSDGESFSTCEWKDVYFCYHNSECWYDDTKKECYWSYDKFLKSCLLDYPSDTYSNCNF